MLEGFVAEVPATCGAGWVPGSRASTRGTQGILTCAPVLFTRQRKDSLFRNKCGKLSCESPRIVIFKSFSDKDTMLNLGKFNDSRAFVWSSPGVESSVFLFQFRPDSIPIFMCCQLCRGRIFLLDAFAPGNLNAQEFLDCKIAPLKMQTGHQPHSESLGGRRQRGGARLLGLSPRSSWQATQSVLSGPLLSCRMGPQ